MAYESDMVICPYDKSHEIEPERMQFHLVKCAKNFPNQEIFACKYNNLHRIPKPELPFHHEICPDKKKLDTFTHELGDANCPVKDYIDVKEGSVPSDGENWDNEPPCPSALEQIQKDIEEKPVLRALKVSSKAKKKTFHLQERHRLNELIDATSKIDLDSASVPQSSMKKPSVSDNTSAGNTGKGWSTKRAVAWPSSTITGTSRCIPNIEDEFPSLPGTSTSRHFSNNRDVFPGLLAANRNNGFCSLPIPGRGRGRAKNKE